MGGCCCSSRKARVQLHGAPVYIYCPPVLEEQESLRSHDVTASAIRAGLLVHCDLESSIPDTYRPPPLPLPYDMVFGCSRSTDSDSARETISCSSFDTSATCGDLGESDCKVQESSLDISPKKLGLSKSNEPHSLEKEDEDVCPICLEEYETENPKFITKCEHHYHLSCILEWMERSDACPLCDQCLWYSSVNNACTGSHFTNEEGKRRVEITEAPEFWWNDDHGTVTIVRELAVDQTL